MQKLLLLLLSLVFDFSPGSGVGRRAGLLCRWWWVDGSRFLPLPLSVRPPVRPSCLMFARPGGGRKRNKLGKSESKIKNQNSKTKRAGVGPSPIIQRSRVLGWRRVSRESLGPACGQRAHAVSGLLARIPVFPVDLVLLTAFRCFPLTRVGGVSPCVKAG